MPPSVKRHIQAVCLSLVFALICRTRGLALNCHRKCICASNIISCSRMNLTTVPYDLPIYTAVLDLSFNEITGLRAQWTKHKLPNLHNLLLSHNGLHFLSSAAFVFVKQLRNLDLSSNNLRQLGEFIFEPLIHLEVLLLYNNHISQIDRNAFFGLSSLQNLYLSQNRLSRFPVELIRNRSRLEKLSVLDLSSNRMKFLPIPDLQSLPAWMKNRLYLHNNTLWCDCELYSLMSHWCVRQLNSALDFKDDHTCVYPGPDKRVLHVYDLNTHMNCSMFKEEDEEAYLEQTLILSCDTRHRDMSKSWMLPGSVMLSAGTNQSAVVLPDGSLELKSIRPENSGVYTCFAVSKHLNETLYVVVKVHNFTLNGNSETLNTAYTTLVGCLVTVVLVLIYLFLTPCHCFCCPDQGKEPS